MVIRNNWINIKVSSKPVSYFCTCEVLTVKFFYKFIFQKNKVKCSSHSRLRADIRAFFAFVLKFFLYSLYRLFVSSVYLSLSNVFIWSRSLSEKTSLYLFGEKNNLNIFLEGYLSDRGAPAHLFSFLFIFCFSLRIIRFLVRHVKYLLGLQIEVSGQEHLQLQGPYVIISNHQSSLDVLGEWRIPQKITNISRISFT